jgi:hypothetical protein
LTVHFIGFIKLYAFRDFKGCHGGEHRFFAGANFIINSHDGSYLIGTQAADLLYQMLAKPSFGFIGISVELVQ